MQEPILEALTFACNGMEIVASTQDERNLSKISQELFQHVKQFNCSENLTICPFKDCNFELFGIMDPLCENYSKTQEFLKHFLQNHNLVIDNVKGIANFSKYLKKLEEIFRRPNFKLEDLCVSFLMEHPMTLPEGIQSSTITKTPNAEQEHGKFKYFLLTDEVPEEKELRSKLWSERLESVLEINRLEREQDDFPFKCPLFCKEVCIGNRSKLFLHMAEEHSFHVGQPDNIVFVHDFIQLIKNQLDSLKCIYCEKIFKDRTTLREHMRKKQHKRINPLNPEFDRFYLVNYLELGKTWQEIEQEDADEEKVEEDWVELRDETNEIVCLICSIQLNSFDAILEHMKSSHSFDFNEVTKNFSFYDKIKFVNFIRRNVYRHFCFYCENHQESSNEKLQEHLQLHLKNQDSIPDRKVWDDSQFLFPTYENDQILMFLGDKEDEEEAMIVPSPNMEKPCKEKDDGPEIIPEDLADIRIPPIIHPPKEFLDMDF